MEVIELRSNIIQQNFKMNYQFKPVVHKPLVNKLPPKSYLYCSILTLTKLKYFKIEIFHVLDNKVALLTRQGSERATKNCHQRTFTKIWTIDISI